MRYNKLSDIEKEKLVKEYYDEKITATQLAKNYKISRRALYEIINKFKKKKGGKIIKNDLFSLDIFENNKLSNKNIKEPEKVNNSDEGYIYKLLTAETNDDLNNI